MDDEKLISLVQYNDALYNKFSGGYRMPEKKKRIWTEIGAVLGTTGERCYKRWTSLRERYTRERRRFGKAPLSHHRWTLFEALQFLDPHIVPRPTRSENINQDTLKLSPSPHTFDSSLSQQPSLKPVPLFSLVKSELQSSTVPPVPVPVSSSASPLPSLKTKSDSSASFSQYRKRKPTITMEEEFLEAVRTYKTFCKEREEKNAMANHAAIRAFGEMIVNVIISLECKKKQAKAMKLITDVAMTLRIENDE